jgi:hypothetical protein
MQSSEHLRLLRTSSEYLRYLAKLRTTPGKGSDDYADAVSEFVECLVDPRTGEVLGIERATCPSCRIFSPLLDIRLRFRLGCPDCDDTGLACPGCLGTRWVRRATPTSDDPSDNRPHTIKPCPICAVAGEGGAYERDGLRALQALARYYRPRE